MSPDAISLRRALCLAVLLGIAVLAGTAHGKNVKPLLPDWQALAFTCTTEQNPPVDPQADDWFLRARELEKQGISANDAEMIALYKLAAEKGHHKAQLNLAGLYIQGTGVPRDENKAVDLVEKAIQQNSPRAFYLMGVMLQQGVGVKIDETAALSYFRKAADMGDPYGQLAVGESLRNASVNLPEPERRRGYQIALTMLNCSLSQDLPEAGHLLGRHYLNFENDIHQALEYFQRAAALGYNDSLYRLYTIFDEGEYGIQKDPQRAACYYELRKQLKTEPGRRFPDIDRLCPLPPPPA
ncbi:tetratricopeptide repeat protein, partial [Pseudomonas aeruginosa]